MQVQYKEDVLRFIHPCEMKQCGSMTVTPLPQLCDYFLLYIKQL